MPNALTRPRPCTAPRLLLHATFAALAVLAAARPAGASDYAQVGPHRVEVIETTWTDAARKRSLPLRIRVPDALGARPVVLFSHGLGGSVDGGRYWGEQWASHGFVVIHLQHPGSDEPVWRHSDRPLRDLRRAASTEAFAARVADVKFVLDELQRRQAAGDPLALRADLERVGMSGHSFGAVTTQALAGQRYEVPRRLRAEADALVEPRLRAFIAFSPSARDDKAMAQFASIARPFFSITGTADGEVGLGLGVPAPNRLLPFEGMPGPDAYLMNLDGADHMIFNGAPRLRTNGVDPVRDELQVMLTRAVTTVFWRAYLMDDAAALAWLRQQAAALIGPAGQLRMK